eukprot:COSAG06_NODE_45882_length_351_cov_0.821429_1_plen_72_part_01
MLCITGQQDSATLLDSCAEAATAAAAFIPLGALFIVSSYVLIHYTSATYLVLCAVGSTHELDPVNNNGCGCD